jgi:hypothetical protein
VTGVLTYCTYAGAGCRRTIGAAVRGAATFTTALEAAVVGQQEGEQPVVGQQSLEPQLPVGQLKQEVVGPQLVVGQQLVVGAK